ncbi:unnamed protein product [Phytophthora fragariaefolia]|uniref:Unnamed protein product n=1 Tax=Phytophthora fragariaefolia TaxID=1490495 RepID=A0A9W6U723_9STRA|nr:unnamed protein product [Phytophthora fragariaefolia]
MIERQAPDKRLNSAFHTPVESAHHNRRPHTIARESWRATGSDFDSAFSIDIRLTKRSRRLGILFSSADAGSESQMQGVEQHSTPGADISPTLQAADDSDRTKAQLIPAWEAVVSAEAGVRINENEEDDELTEDDRIQMGALRDVAVDGMEEFLSETLARLGVDEMATMREIVQNFRTLAVYFRKSSKLEHVSKIFKRRSWEWRQKSWFSSKLIAQHGGTVVGIC